MAKPMSGLMNDVTFITRCWTQMGRGTVVFAGW
jgi:hypothetical protein